MVVAAVLLTAWLLIAPDLHPVPGRARSKTPPPCHTTRQLALIGTLNDCAVAAATGRTDCAPPADAGIYNFVGRLHGGRHDYLLYVEVHGIYSGPGTYQLRPWPTPTLGGNDGVPRVAVREFISGDLWESSGGQVSIGTDRESGSLSATLSQRSGPPSPSPDLHLDGHWACG